MLYGVSFDSCSMWLFLSNAPRYNRDTADCSM